MMRKGNLNRRLKELEKKAGIGTKEIKLWRTQGSLEDTDKQIEAITAGKVKHPDGSFYSPDDNNYFINTIFLPDEQCREMAKKPGGSLSSDREEIKALVMPRPRQPGEEPKDDQSKLDILVVPVESHPGESEIEELELDQDEEDLPSENELRREIEELETKIKKLKIEKRGEK